ncbi:CAP domain-containing protein [Streptomyces sp. NPDC017958]|uniref:CAP domain-containing protein n=1 Tax=Streptomyces sp. NPDC017958 TaxID=3365021 RepID=UPI0037A6E133
MSDRLSRVGCEHRSAGENVAYGHNSPESVMDGWMNSSGHRANILSCGFKEIRKRAYSSPVRRAAGAAGAVRPLARAVHRGQQCLPSEPKAPRRTMSRGESRAGTCCGAREQAAPPVWDAVPASSAGQPGQHRCHQEHDDRRKPDHQARRPRRPDRRPLLFLS